MQDKGINSYFTQVVSNFEIDLKMQFPPKKKKTTKKILEFCCFGEIVCSTWRLESCKIKFNLNINPYNLMRTSTNKKLDKLL